MKPPAGSTMAVVKGLFADRFTLHLRLSSHIRKSSGVLKGHGFYKVIDFKCRESAIKRCISRYINTDLRVDCRYIVQVSYIGSIVLRVLRRVGLNYTERCILLRELGWINSILKKCA